MATKSLNPEPQRASAASRPLLLDLFCGAGGAAMGYHRAGFDVVGVDIANQPRSPFEFVRCDALTIIEACTDGHAAFYERFHAIHASPPCQGYSVQGGDHPLLIEPVRDALDATGLLYIIENIADAAWAMREPTVLCGSSFGLRVRRHRLFETNWPLMGVACAHGLQRSNPHRIRAPYEPPEDAIVPVYGGSQVGFSADRCRAAMGIDWMTTDELKEAIPPAYTEFIGAQLFAHVRERQAVAA